MVRFSDIKEIRDRTSGPRDSAPAKDGEASRLWLSDTQFSELGRDEDRTPEDIGAERDSSDVAVLYEKFTRSAKEIQEKVTSEQGVAPAPILADLHTVIDRDLIQPLFEHAMSKSGDWKDM